MELGSSRLGGRVYIIIPGLDVYPEVEELRRTWMECVEVDWGEAVEGITKIKSNRSQEMIPSTKCLSHKSEDLKAPLQNTHIKCQAW